MAPSFFSCLAVVGAGVPVLAVTCSALRYRGKSCERFPLLNHFISELGERGVSHGAWAFNGGLVLAGLLLLPFAVHMGIVLGSVLGWAGAFFAAAASLGAAAVGIFPMNTLKRHVPAAIAFGSFVVVPPIVIPNPGRMSLLDPQVMPERPRFWILPVLDWLAFFSTILWMFGMSFFFPGAPWRRVAS